MFVCVYFGWQFLRLPTVPFNNLLIIVPVGINFMYALVLYFLQIYHFCSNRPGSKALPYLLIPLSTPSLSNRSLNSLSACYAGCLKATSMQGRICQGQVCQQLNTILAFFLRYVYQLKWEAVFSWGMFSQFVSAIFQPKTCLESVNTLRNCWMVFLLYTAHKN